MSETTHDGKRGGITKGKRHKTGGMPAVVVDTGQPIELEGGEVIINRAASRKHCKALSEINQSAGNGVAIPCGDIGSIQNYYETGGQLTMFDNMETDHEPADVTPAEIEKRIVEIDEKYSSEYDKILNYPKGELEKSQIDQQRSELLSWIKAPLNNVKVLIAFSGGKDSVAMVLKAIYIDKIPKDQIQLWHHDVDGDGEDIFDWKCTKSYCKAFAKAMGVEILFSFSGGGLLKEVLRGVGDSENRIPYSPPRYQQITKKDKEGNEYVAQGAELFKTDQPETRQPMYFQIEHDGEFIKAEPRENKGSWETGTGDFKVKGKFPAVVSDLKTRWCSSVVKIEVMARAISNVPSLKDRNIVIMTGERRQESKGRAGYSEIEKYARSSKKSGIKAITWRSVIDMLEVDIWKLYEKHRIQPHPCYELGWGRCSCQLCIFSSANVWAANQELSPLKVARISEIETYIGFPLYNEKNKSTGEIYPNVYQSKVQFGESFLTQELIDRWKDEALGEFTSPIIVNGKWTMPIGAKNGEQAGAI